MHHHAYGEFVKRIVDPNACIYCTHVLSRWLVAAGGAKTRRGRDRSGSGSRKPCHFAPGARRIALCGTQARANGPHKARSVQRRRVGRIPELQYDLRMTFLSASLRSVGEGCWMAPPSLSAVSRQHEDHCLSTCRNARRNPQRRETFHGNPLPVTANSGVGPDCGTRLPTPRPCAVPPVAVMSTSTRRTEPSSSSKHS